MNFFLFYIKTNIKLTKFDISILFCYTKKHSKGGFYMFLTYEEFKKIVPKETLEFVERVLPLIDDYKITKNHRIEGNTIKIKINNGQFYRLRVINDVVLAILLHTYYKKNQNNATLLTKYDYDDKKLLLEDTQKPVDENTYSKLLQTYQQYFCFDNNLLNYQTLTPTKIIVHLLDTNNYLSSHINLFDKKITYHLFEDEAKFSKFHIELQKINEAEQRKMQEDMILNFKKDLPPETIAYFEMVSKIHQTIEELSKNTLSFIHNTDDIIATSLFLTFLKGSTTNIRNYLNYLGIYNVDIENILNLKFFDTKEIEKKKNPDYQILQMYYSKFKQPKLEKIVENLGNKELIKSEIIEKIFQILNKDINILTNIEENQNEMKIKTFLNDQTLEVKNFLGNVLKIHSLLQKQITNTTDYNIDLITQKEDITLLSILFALFDESKENYYLLEKNGLSFINLASICEIDPTLFQNKDQEKPNKQVLIDEYLPVLGDKTELTIKDILKYFLPENNFLEKIMQKLNKNYSILETEITTGIERIPTLEERYASLANLEVPSIDIHSTESIIYFGDALVEHSEFITVETSKLLESREIDKSSDLIMKITSELNSSLSPSKKRNLLSIKAFLLRKKQAPFSLIENNENLEQTINKSINTLQKEIIRYDKILTYLNLYQRKNNEHLSKITEAIEIKKSEDLQSNNQNITALIGSNAYMNFLEDKKNIFETADAFITSEIIRIGGIMVNHSLSLKALIISKQDLLPLVKAELTFIESSKNEAQALTIYTNILNLCQNLYSQNIDGIKSSMEIFRPNMAENTFIKIESDVNNYLLQLQSTSTTENNNTTRKLI